MALITGFLASAWPILALIGGSIIAVVAVGFRLINIGKANQKAADQEVAIQNEVKLDKSVTDALNADSRVRTDAANGRLRDDDGYKRH